jgi:hypothetical protein
MALITSTRQPGCHAGRQRILAAVAGTGNGRVNALAVSPDLAGLRSAGRCGR